MGTKVTPYTDPEKEAKKNQVQRMFDSIAPRYDFLNHFFPWVLMSFGESGALEYSNEKTQCLAIY